ncbi:MAG: FAD-binding oxidoreductase, partial [Bacilli bacterium]|nr:FAD-binding oxidoreductase [Bacilli bacterium]
MYKKIDDKDIKYFSSFFDKDHLFVDDLISPDYSRDELSQVQHMPEMVLVVSSTDEVSKVLKYANEKKIPVTVRGSGTGLVGACVPLEGGIVLDMSKMNHILSLDEDNLTLTVEPGVLLMDIYSYVEPKGYFYAPDPGEKTATIGGNISTNAGGMRAVKYGVTRDWVMALEVVLADGTVTNFGRNVVKDSTGYSLKNLIIGSEGTLCVITKAVLKLIPKPDETISLLVPFSSKELALKAVPNIIKENLDTTCIEFFEKNTIAFAEEYLGRKFPNTKSEAYILLTFDAKTKELLKHNYEKAADICINKLNAIDALIVDTDERKDAVWKARGAFLEAIKASTTEMDECDVVVPRAKVADYINFTIFLEKKYNIRIPSFGHAGDGNLHIYVCRDKLSKGEFKKKLDAIFKEMYDKANEVGGLISGEHGIGLAKMSYMHRLLGDRQIELMRGIKKVFDPNGILNPNKII